MEINSTTKMSPTIDIEYMDKEKQRGKLYQGVKGVLLKSDDKGAEIY